MRVGIWLSVVAGFGVLLLLVSLFAWLLWRKTAEIDLRMKDSHQRYQQADDAITDIRANIYRGALLGRDATGSQDKFSIGKQLAALRFGTREHLASLSSLLDATQHVRLAALSGGLTKYWESLARSSPENKPEAVLALAEEIDALNEANLNLEEQQIQSQQHALREFAAAAGGLLFLLGLVIAISTTAYMAKLERASQTEKLRAEKAQSELRRLSNQLVRVQEEERKNISRELHDEVGQILTGLRMELGSLASGEADGTFQQRLESVKLLAADALRSVRNVALVLRPSMLDDLGLEPALRWQAKEFSRRSDIPVSVDIEGDIGSLPETVRICLYRVIQEALTNCMKHAGASRVTVKVKQAKDIVTADIQDDGSGFEIHHLRTQGLGLLGMEERIRALQGKLTVFSEPRKGTLIHVTLPTAH